ncbi:MAG: CGNR zinc finger domain-containing protein [Actinomycetia bacterium]|nr:CGNR zinc finger domain-containing protein [Actinomycetes bacterium]MCL2731352.1 CGNR zinc finger domain-containing protein [Actinomycetes bacterium]
MAADHLAVALAVTIRHDGHGGVTDDLADPAGLTRWARAHAAALVPAGYEADAGALAAVVAVRTAVRALFARAVLPGPPSSADAGRLPDADAALAALNAAAGRVPLVPRLDWPSGEPPRAGFAPAGAARPADRLAAGLAHAAVTFLAGPDRARLRACPAPRCVRYFVQDHPRQEWCKPACGNRARVARHHARHRVPDPG